LTRRQISFKTIQKAMLRPKAFLTPRDLADAVGASESSLKRWADEGVIRATRTAGGHRRIALAEAIRFVRESRLTIERPELLGFEEVIRTGAAGESGTADALFDAFEQDEWRVARALIVSSFLSGESVAALCDGPIREALRRAGELWQHGQGGIVVEHRAVDVCLQALGTIRASLPPPAADGPVAIGAGAAGDPYLLPSLMASTVLAEAGYRDVNLGPDMPTEPLLVAVERYAPAIVWRTASVPVELEPLLRDLETLADRAAQRGGRLVLGGRGVPAGPFALPAGVHHLGSMGELMGFARGLRAVQAGAEAPRA
jgi:excisionase family DNA binding protein